MASLVRTLFVVALLAMPVLVVLQLPHLLELAGSVPAPPDTPFATPPAFRLFDVTPTAVSSSRFSPLDPTPPPTLSPPATRPTAAPTPRATATGERIVIGNTGGQGAVLRADPVTGRPVGALRDTQVLDVLEHRNVPGGGDWVHVRTADGLEGWVTGLVARPLPTATP